MVVLGFHPGRASMKYQIATPLLIANILRWMAPETFRSREVQAGTVGTVSVPVAKDTDPATIRVLDENQRPLPVHHCATATLQFFSGAPGAVSVLTGDRETVYSLTLPDVAEAVWRPPANVRRGIPRAAELESPPQDLWPWLAVAGRLGIAARLAAVRPQPPVPLACSEHRAWPPPRRPKEGLMTFDRTWVLPSRGCRSPGRPGNGAARAAVWRWPQGAFSAGDSARAGRAAPQSQRNPSRRRGSGGHLRQRFASRSRARLATCAVHAIGARPSLDARGPVRALHPHA